MIAETQMSEEQQGCNPPSISTDIDIYAELQLPNYVIRGGEIRRMNIDEIYSLYGLFPRGVSMAVGSSDVGKSMLLHQLLMCVASRQSFLGNEFNGKYGRCVCVLTEDDQSSTSFRQRKQNMSLKLSDEQIDNIFYIYDSESIVQKLDELLTMVKCDLVVCDALGDLFNGKDLNANNQVRQFLNEFSNVANRHQTPIVFLHHTSKRSEDLAPNKNNSIGSQGIEAKSRFVAELRHNKQNENIRSLCVVKANYLPSSAKNASFDLFFDEHFIFTDTGQRTPFEQLAASQGNSGKRESKAPQSVDDGTHTAFLQALYTRKGLFFTSSQLNERLIQRFEISDKTARQYVGYYEGRKWIVNKSKVKSRYEYHLHEVTARLW